MVAYWVTPAEPARSFFASSIADLAVRFEAPLFEPHVTVYACEKKGENPPEILSDAMAHWEPIRLAVRDIQCSDEFTKTLFVQFEPSAELARLSNAIKEASGMDDDYGLNPHLSLIYKKMPLETKMEIANSLCLPFTEVEFDSVKAIVSSAKIATSDDVNSWRVVATRLLSR